MQLLVFTDASFANNEDLSSQIGYIIVLTDATKKANIVNWSSVKCKRVTQSVLASELYGVAHGFDIGTAIKSTAYTRAQVQSESQDAYDWERQLERWVGQCPLCVIMGGGRDILQIDLPLVLCTDSKSLYDCLVRLGTTREKRLMIDVMFLRQAFARRLITEVKWIDGEANPADAMTKGRPCPALTQLIDTDRIDLQAVGWVERSPAGITDETKGTRVDDGYRALARRMGLLRTDGACYCVYATKGIRGSWSALKPLLE